MRLAERGRSVGNQASINYVGYLLGVCYLLGFEGEKAFIEETRHLCANREQILSEGDSYSDDGIDASLN